MQKTISTNKTHWGSLLFSNKVIVCTGTCFAGKTTFIKDVNDKFGASKVITCDCGAHKCNSELQARLREKNMLNIQLLSKGYNDNLFVDAHLSDLYLDDLLLSDGEFEKFMYGRPHKKVAFFFGLGNVFENTMQIHHDSERVVKNQQWYDANKGMRTNNYRGFLSSIALYLRLLGYDVKTFVDYENFNVLTVIELIAMIQRTFYDNIDAMDNWPTMFHDLFLNVPMGNVFLLGYVNLLHILTAKFATFDKMIMDRKHTDISAMTLILTISPDDHKIIIDSVAKYLFKLRPAYNEKSDKSLEFKKQYQSKNLFTIDDSDEFFAENQQE